MRKTKQRRIEMREIIAKVITEHTNLILVEWQRVEDGIFFREYAYGADDGLNGYLNWDKDCFGDAGTLEFAITDEESRILEELRILADLLGMKNYLLIDTLFYSKINAEDSAINAAVKRVRRLGDKIHALELIKSALLK